MCTQKPDSFKNVSSSKVRFLTSNELICFQAAIKKGKKLDLSKNQISILPVRKQLFNLFNFESSYCLFKFTTAFCFSDFYVGTLLVK